MVEGTVEGMGRGILIVFIIGFILELTTNVFGVFPWMIATVTATNSAAKEAGTYNTFFKETRVSFETQLTNLPGAIDTVPASEWLPIKEEQLIASGVDSKIVKLADDNVLANSKVVMVESHGYMGVSYESSVKPSQQDQQSIETALTSSGDTSSKIGKYLEDIDIYTFTAYPLQFKIGSGSTHGVTVYIPWVYHSGSVGLHLFRGQYD